MSSNTNIGNTPVNQGYVQLIHTGETGGIDGTLRTLYDGDGTASDLQIASNKVKVSTELYIGSKTATEFIQDIVGDMFTTGSYTNITTTYDDTNGNIDLSASGEVTLTGTQTLTNKTLASPTFTGTANGVNLTLSGDLTVNGTTTTLDTTNLKVTDNLIELNQGVASNANDSGIIIERGSTGDNAIFMWDESADKFTLGTTTATADATGNIIITTGTLVASTFEGNLTGNVTGNVTGSASLNLLTSNNLSDLANAATARTNLGVDPAGTDNSTDVTLAGTLDYITIAGQTITRNAIDLTTDVTGTLPVGNGGTGLTSISTLLNSNVTPTSLGLVIGTDVQAQDTLLQDIADFSLSNPSQDGYLIAYSDAEPQLELVAPGISFNGSTANGLLTYGNSTTADVETDLVYNATGLGIGTTSPEGKVHIYNGDANVAPDSDGDELVVENSGDSGISILSGESSIHTGSLIFGSANDAFGAGLQYSYHGNKLRLMTANTGHKLEFATDNNTTAMTIDSSQNVGIGGTPVNFTNYVNLDVKTNALGGGVIGFHDSGGTRVGCISHTESLNTFAVEAFNSHPMTFLTNNSEAMRIDSSGNVGIGTSALNSNYKMIVKRTTNCNLGVGLQGGELSLEAFNDAITASVPFRLYGSEFNMLNGNVGIGTTSPGEKLTIKAGGDTSQEVIKIRNSSNTEILSLGIDGSGDGYLNFNSSPAVINTNGGHLALTPGGSGNVGIGTSSPSNGLELYGAARNIYVTNTTEDAAGIIMQDAQDPGQNGKIVYDSGSNELSIQVHSGTGYIMDSTRQSEFVRDVGHAQNTVLVIKSDDSDGDQGASSSADIDFHIWDSNTRLSTPQARIGIRGDGTANQNNEAGGTLSFYTNIQNYSSPSLTEALRIDPSQDAHFDQDVIAFSTTPSDIRLKENFEKIENGLDIVSQLEGHTFNWKKGGDRLSAGFKAQEVEKILPHLVDEKKLPLRADDDKEYKILRYEEMIPYLVEAIKQLKTEIEELKNG